MESNIADQWPIIIDENQLIPTKLENIFEVPGTDDKVYIFVDKREKDISYRILPLGHGPIFLRNYILKEEKDE